MSGEDNWRHFELKVTYGVSPRRRCTRDETDERKREVENNNNRSATGQRMMRMVENLQPHSSKKMGKKRAEHLAKNLMT